MDVMVSYCYLLRALGPLFLQSSGQADDAGPTEFRVKELHMVKLGSALSLVIR